MDDDNQGGTAGTTRQFVPVNERERIVALDVLRGVAIMGILFVNMAFFSGPMAEMMNPAVLADANTSEQVAWGAIKVLGELKFVSLFSLLFGIGMIMQMQRAARSGRGFAPTYFRRVIVLLGFGLVHGLLLWYGDILTMYAVGGVLLFFARKWSAPVLVLTAAALLVVSLLAAVGVQSLGVISEEMAREKASSDNIETQADEASSEQQADVSPGSTTGDPRVERWLEAYSDWKAAQFDVIDESFARMEHIAYGEGPMLITLATRGLTFVGYLVVATLGGFSLRVLALFLLGAALMKWGFFDASMFKVHLWMFLIGVGVGLPLEITMYLIYAAVDFQLTFATVGAEAIHWIASLMLMFGYVGGICTLVHAGALRPVAQAFAAVGRMALTNYLLQTVVMTGIMYWWGFGLFGEFTRVQQLGLAAGLFACQIVLSLLWLRLFRFGPMEWLWRSLAYWKLQPLR